MRTFMGPNLELDIGVLAKVATPPLSTTISLSNPAKQCFVDGKTIQFPGS